MPKAAANVSAKSVRKPAVQAGKKKAPKAVQKAARKAARNPAPRARAPAAGVAEAGDRFVDLAAPVPAGLRFAWGGAKGLTSAFNRGNLVAAVKEIGGDARMASGWTDAFTPDVLVAGDGTSSKWVAKAAKVGAQVWSPQEFAHRVRPPSDASQRAAAAWAKARAGEP